MPNGPSRTGVEARRNDETPMTRGDPYNADVIFVLGHLAFLLWTTSLLPSGSRNCAIQQTGVSIFSMSNETPRSFSFVMLASMSSTSKATVVPSREGFHAG